MSGSCSDTIPARPVRRRARRGFVLLTTCAMVLLVLLPAIGLAIDAGMIFMVQGVLSAASDACFPQRLRRSTHVAHQRLWTSCACSL